MECRVHRNKNSGFTTIQKPGSGAIPGNNFYFAGHFFSHRRNLKGARAVFTKQEDQGSFLFPARIFFVVEIIHRRFRIRWRRTKSPRRIPDQSWRSEISAAGRITLLNPVSCNTTVYFKSPVTKQTKKVIPMRRSTSHLSLTLSI